VGEIVGGQVLAVVVLDPLGEPQPGIAECDVRLVIAAAPDAVEAPHRQNLEVRQIHAVQSPDVPAELPAR